MSDPGSALASIVGTAHVLAGEAAARHAVAGRALIQMKPQKRRDLRDILAAYALGTAAPPSPRARRRR